MAVFALATSFIISGYGTRSSFKKEIKEDKELLIEFVVRDQSVEDALTILGNKYNVSIIHDENLSGRVTCTFKNMTMEEAILTILGREEYKVSKSMNIYRVSRLNDKFSVEKELFGDNFKGEKTVELSPEIALKDDNESLLNEVSEMIEENSIDEAEEFLKDYTGINTENAMAHALLGNIYKEKKMLLSAKNSWEKVIALEKNNDEVKKSLSELEKIIIFVKKEKKKKNFNEKLNAYLR